MLEYLWLIWLLSAPIMIYYFIRALQNHKAYEQKTYNYKTRSTKKIVFQFCSRDAPLVVYQAIKRVHQACKAVGYSNYQVDLVTDIEVPNIIMKRINAKNVVVPSDYQTKPPVKYKARALQYAIDQRKKHRQANTRRWIYLLDEESMVTEQTVRALLQYISSKNAKPIAEGGIIYPNNFFHQNLLCSIAETLRTYVCYDCVTQMSSGRMPSHIHGSNLLVRADLEAKIGWAHEKGDASEDQRFAWEATLKFGPDLFGWHGGTIEEQPANNIRDFIKQRQRWFLGNVHNLRYAKVPIKKKIIVALRWLNWMAGFPAGLASFLILLIPQNIPLGFHIFLLFNTFTWMLGYQVGLRLNLKKYELPKSKKILWHLITLALTPIVGIVETFGVFIAPLQWHNFDRSPTPKSLERETKTLIISPKGKQRFEESLIALMNAPRNDSFEYIKSTIDPNIFHVDAPASTYNLTNKQHSFLEYETNRRGIHGKKAVTRYKQQVSFKRQTWRKEIITVRGKPQVRHRDIKTGRFIKKRRFCADIY